MFISRADRIGSCRLSPRGSGGAVPRLRVDGRRGERRGQLGLRVVLRCAHETMKLGKDKRMVTVTMRNTGTTTWAKTFVRETTQADRDDDEDELRGWEPVGHDWGVGAVDVSGSVAPNASRSFRVHDHGAGYTRNVPLPVADGARHDRHRAAEDSREPGLGVRRDDAEEADRGGGGHAADVRHGEDPGPGVGGRQERSRRFLCRRRRAATGSCRYSFFGLPLAPRA